MADEEEKTPRPDLEIIYDTVIQPLMRAVAEACVQHDISFVAGFQFSEQGVATMQWLDPKNDDERLKVCHLILNSGGGACTVAVVPIRRPDKSGVLN